jgi:transposase
MTNRTFKTGTRREQPSFLPPRIEDYVGVDNMVRAIDAFVDGCDLRGLGFRHAGYEGGAGQPPYDPADLLKLYLYGYLNRVRSSRSLERETQRNIEVMWLLEGLTPGYRTIGNFRKDNWTALKAANREFVVLIRDLDLVGGTLVAIDGAFFDGNASKASIKSRKRLAEQAAAIDRDIEAYRSAVEAQDAAETENSPAGDGGEGDRGDVAQQIAGLMEKRAKVQADLARLEQSGETQLSSTDADARLLSKTGQVVAGYNVQIAVDEKHKLIVASEVVNDGNDKGQLYEMAQAAKEALEVETLEAVADAGYYSGPALKECEDNKIVAYVPAPQRMGREGRFTHEDFAYDAAENVYRCPAGEVLRPTKTLKENGGRREIVYSSRKSSCDQCELRSRCLSAKGDTRTVNRWEHADVLDRHRERMKEADARLRLRQRACLAEHPFGTLKCRAGYRHFLVRGFDKVRGEWSLMALCYNFSRVLSILGFQGFMDYLAQRRAAWAILFAVSFVAAAMRRARAFVVRFAAEITQNWWATRLHVGFTH